MPYESKVMLIEKRCITVLNVCKISELRKHNFVFEILHDLKQF